MEHSPKLASATSPQRKSRPKTRRTGAAVTPRKDFSFLRNSLLKNHLPHPAAPNPPPAVRFGPSQTDNQSAGKLRPGFQPRAAVHAPGTDNRPGHPAPIFDNRTRQQTPSALFLRGSPANHSGSRPWAPEPVVRKRRREPYISGQLGIGYPPAILQKVNGLPWNLPIARCLEIFAKIQTPCVTGRDRASTVRSSRRMILRSGHPPRCQPDGQGRTRHLVQPHRTAPQRITLAEKLRKV